MRRVPAAPALALTILSAATSALAQDSADPTAALAAALQRAQTHLTENEMEAAESDFRDALLEGWLLLGALEAAEDRLDQAAEAFERAGVSAVETRRAHIGRAMVALRQDDSEQAVGLLRGVVLRQPDSGEARRLLAQALVAAGRPAEAIQELEEALFANPEDQETAFALGSGYLRSGKIDEGERLLQQVAAARPIPQTHVLIGRTFRDFQYYERAREALNRALEMDPDVHRARYYLGTIELLSMGRDGLPSAVRLFEAELDRYPDDPMTNLYLGLALSEDRHFEEALPALQHAAAWPPTRLDALRFIGRCHLGLDQLGQAESTLREALELTESGATTRQLSRIHYQLGLTLRRLGDAAEAETHFEAARGLSAELVDAERENFERFLADSIRDEPSAKRPGQEISPLGSLTPAARGDLRRRIETAVARSYYNLGTLFARSNQFGRATEAFASADSVVPDFPGLQRSLGVAAFRAHQFAEAAKALESAASLEPGNLELQRMLALTWLNLEVYDRAAVLLEDEALRASDASLEYTYALALLRAGRTAEAQPVFDRLVTEHADWPELYVLLGQAHAQREDFPAAIVSLERALELDARVAEANSTLGEIYLRQGRLDEAESSLRAELTERPSDIRSRYLLAVVLDLANRPDEAVEHLRAVLGAQPDNADARYLMGKIRLAAGAAPEATMHLEAAATLAPEDANIRYQLAQALQRLGRRDEAAEQLEIYRRLKEAEGAGGA